MSYKVYLPAALDSIAWSQVTWRFESESPADDVEGELIYDVLLDSLPPGGLVVDAGCGVARWPSELRRRGRRVVGIDLSPAALALAQRRDPALSLVVADSRRLPLRSHSVDAVISLGVVEHEEAGPVESLRELHRVLKPGGILVLDVPYDNLLRRLLLNHAQTWVTRRRRRAGWDLGFAEYRFTHREVTTFLRRAGFEPATVHPNDLRPPRNMGLWVDYHNLIFDPARPTLPAELFLLPAPFGRLAGAVMQRAPWALCGAITVVARAR